MHLENITGARAVAVVYGPQVARQCFGTHFDGPYHIVAHVLTCGLKHGLIRRTGPGPISAYFCPGIVHRSSHFEDPPREWVFPWAGQDRWGSEEPNQLTLLQGKMGDE